MTGFYTKAIGSELEARSNSGVLWVLFAGMVLALAGNVYQFVEAERISRDLAQAQREVQTQLADMRELESGTLEQNLRRFDQLNKQIEGLSAQTLKQTKSEVRRMLGE